MENARLGGKVRTLRRREGLTQAQLAERLGISASYMNLLENNRRPLTAALLIKIAQVLQVDLQAFASEEDRLVPDLMEVFGDPMFDAFELSGGQIRDVVTTSPQLSRAVLHLYQAYRSARESVEQLASQGDGDRIDAVDASRLPSAEVSALIQRRQNYFPELEEGSERLRRDARLDEGDLFENLSRYLLDHHRIKVEISRIGTMGRAVRRYDGKRRVLQLSEILRRGSRNFQLAHQAGLLNYSEVLDKIARDDALTTDDSRALCRIALANYFAGAVLMPYQPFLEAARAERYDIELLGHRFRASFEQVCHRLTTLQRPRAEGVAFHLVRIDLAGNISKRFSASGLRISHYSAACPKWAVHSAFLTPGMIRVQLSRMPDGTTFFEIARTLRKETGGFHASRPMQAISLGCDVSQARELVYADGIDLDTQDAAVPVGVTCRVCERLECEQRAFPRMQQPLRLDENVRGASFYAPVD